MGERKARSPGEEAVAPVLEAGELVEGYALAHLSSAQKRWILWQACSSKSFEVA